MITSFKKICVCAGIVAMVVTYASLATHRAMACTTLPVNLLYGDNGADVLALQQFLFSRGYLTATPNGHFGPATLVAVKKFQSENAIATVGSVGPLTRAAVGRLSCEVATPTPIPTSYPTTLPTPTPTVTPTPTPASTMVVTPQAGSVLTIGASIPIAWTDPFNTNNYSILLEQPNGVGAGYIFMGSYVAHQYMWKVGTIMSGAQPVNPGTYRIHIVNMMGGAHAFDQYSGTFSIVAPPITITSNMPASIPADDTTVGVLYGFGFTNVTVVYVDGVYATHVLYVSPDGRALVYTIPVTVPAGSHAIQASNVYTSGQSALSGSVPLTITTSP